MPLACLAWRGRLIEISVTGQREVSFDLADFYHNESRLLGVDSLKLDLTASAGILEALAPGFESPVPAIGSHHAEIIDLADARRLSQSGRRRRRPHRHCPLAMRPAVTAVLVSLTMGLAVGIAYGLSGIRSPAPPLIALVSLLGMVLGEQAVTMTKAHFLPSAAQRIRRTAERARPRTDLPCSSWLWPHCTADSSGCRRGGHSSTSCSRHS